MLLPTRTYSGGGVEPCFNRERALNLPVALPNGIAYVKGTVLGRIVGTGTAVNDVQTITPGGTVSGGSFRISFGGQVTAAVAFDADAATFKAALAALSNIGSTANLTVTGGGLNAAAFVVTFIGTMAGMEQPLMLFINSLTGAGATATIAHTTFGKPAGGYYAKYDEAGNDDGRRVAKCVLEYAASTDTYGNITLGDTVGAGDNNTVLREAPAWFQGEFRCSELIGLDANGVADLGKIIRGDPATLTAATTILRIT